MASPSDVRQPKRIVILGAGFGGAYAARRLRSQLGERHARVTLVSRENYFLFTPLLHEVATGGLGATTIVEPLRQILGGDVNIRLGEVRRVRLADSVVETSSGELAFDVLLIALGAETNFFGIPGAAENCFTLKSLRDAIGLKQRCIDAFEAAAVAPDAVLRRKLLRFAVVGGGPTGVELAAELAEFVRGSLLPMYRAALGGAEPRITLIQQADDLLPQFSPAIRRKALETLAKKGIDVRLKTAVMTVDADGVVLSNGTRVDSMTTVWVAGVRPAPLDFDFHVDRDGSGRFVVDGTLRLVNHGGIFAIGDIAASVPEGGTVPLPPFAQVAVAQADHAVDNVIRLLDRDRLEPFAYRHRGNLVSLGQWMAAAEIGGMSFWGHFTWWLWRTVYLSKFISTRKKFSIALQWTINLVSPRDASRV